MNNLDIDKILTLDSSIYTNCKDYNEKFEKLATYLIKNVVLVINKKDYQICELEFYLKSNDHPDAFTHGDADQQVKGKFYFHRQNGGSYKGGTYKGLDITFKNKGNDKKSYNGALVRSIYDLTNQKLIEGPCRVVDHILSKTKHESISSLVEEQLKSTKQKDILQVQKTNGKSLLYLQLDTKNKLQNVTIYSGPRVGLTLKNYSESKVKYIMANYRYLIYPDQISKFKTGIILNMYKNGKTVEEIVQITRSNKKNVEKYMDSYNDAITKKLTAKHYDSKKLGVDDLCKLQKICTA